MSRLKRCPPFISANSLCHARHAANICNFRVKRGSHQPACTQPLNIRRTTRTYSVGRHPVSCSCSIQDYFSFHQLQHRSNKSAEFLLEIHHTSNSASCNIRCSTHRLHKNLYIASQTHQKALEQLHRTLYLDEQQLTFIMQLVAFQQSGFKFLTIKIEQIHILTINQDSNSKQLNETFLIADEGVTEDNNSLSQLTHSNDVSVLQIILYFDKQYFRNSQP
ncbi:Hypothetical_protein [Hexamita inflata]|uniref:Hypothetical_protein n=1 Tax=Hexamita inflata TaxID=28002 RepID=A0AA86U2N4_9EUKA|nr:Hypothetical protein HINF_LOCUS25216 [Hexamita inflata]